MKRLLALPSILALGAVLFGPSPANADHEWVEYAWRAESAHPYPCDSQLEGGPVAPLRIRIPGARAYQIRFEAIDTEPYYDYVEIYALEASGNLVLVQQITGAYHELLSKAIPGAEAWVVIRSDSSNEGFGYRIGGVRAQVEVKRGTPQPPSPGPSQPWGPRPNPAGPETHGPGEPQPPVYGGEYVQQLSDVEFLFGVGDELYELPGRLEMVVGEEYVAVVRGRDQFGQPMPVLTRVLSEGYKGNATLRPDSQDTWVLTAGHHATERARIRIHFPQNPSFDRTLRVTVRPRFEFSYRDNARKVEISIYTGVHRNEAAQVNLFHSIDPANLTGGEDVTALVEARTGPHSTLFLKADHAYPLQRAVNYFTMVVRRTDGSTVQMTYSIEYKKANPTPVHTESGHDDGGHGHHDHHDD